MTGEIIQKLHEIEQTNNIRIIYAVESGSRAWGFASPDSDYDVRYIYVRRPEDYMRVDEVRDTIEGPLDDVMDFSGWDIKKALELLRRTNPSLMEWTHSPIVYLRTTEWELFAQTVPCYFDVLSNMHHYMSMTLQHWNKYMQGEKAYIKKYLYVMRPLLACRWLEKYASMPPVLFNALRAQTLPEHLNPAMDELLHRKKLALEAELIDHIPALDEFITSETKRLHSIMDGMEKKELQGFDELNALFRAIVKGAWNRNTFA